MTCYIFQVCREVYPQECNILATLHILVFSVWFSDNLCFYPTTDLNLSIPHTLSARDLLSKKSEDGADFWTPIEMLICQCDSEMINRLVHQSYSLLAMSDVSSKSRQVGTKQ